MQAEMAHQEVKNKEVIKMKKIIIFLMALMIVSATFLAGGNSQVQGNYGQKNNDNNASTNSSVKDTNQTKYAYQVNTQQQTANQANASNIQVQQQLQLNQNDGNKSGPTYTIQNQYQSHNSSQTEQQIRSTIQQKGQEVNSTMPNSTQNQKMAAVAVQTIESTASMFGKSEANISRISNEIKNSFEISTRAEERIRDRSGFVKFITGGDNEAAGLIVQEIARNENRIRELNRLIEESDFDSQTKAVLQDQVQNIEQEQLRLKALAQEELNNKGLFGWIWK